MSEQIDPIRGLCIFLQICDSYLFICSLYVPHICDLIHEGHMDEDIEGRSNMYIYGHPEGCDLGII